MKKNLLHYVLTVTNLFEYKTEIVSKNLIFFVSLLYSVSFSVVDGLTGKGHFFLKQIYKESLICSCLAQLVRHWPSEDQEVLVSIPTGGNF